MQQGRGQWANQMVQFACRDPVPSLSCRLSTSRVTSSSDHNSAARCVCPAVVHSLASPLTDWPDLKPDLTSWLYTELQVCLNCVTKLPGNVFNRGSTCPHNVMWAGESDAGLQTFKHCAAVLKHTCALNLLQYIYLLTVSVKCKHYPAR